MASLRRCYEMAPPLRPPRTSSPRTPSQLFHRRTNYPRSSAMHVDRERWNEEYEGQPETSTEPVNNWFDHQIQPRKMRSDQTLLAAAAHHALRQSLDSDIEFKDCHWFGTSMTNQRIGDNFPRSPRGTSASGTFGQADQSFQFIRSSRWRLCLRNSTLLFMPRPVKLNVAASLCPYLAPPPTFPVLWYLPCLYFSI
jgi:hypothetical protein